MEGRVAQDPSRRAELNALTAAADVEAPLPAFHPNMANVFRQKTEMLVAALERDEEHDAARQTLRGFLEKIIIPPGEGLLQVVGNLGEMLTTAAGSETGAAAVGYVGCGDRI